MSKLDSYTPLGYSLCVVVEVGSGAEEFAVEDATWRRPATSSPSTPS